jgi:hypothetical protein
MFDGDLIAGPVPTMFAEDPEVTKDALKADIYRAHFDMAKFERVFLQPEHVDLGEAFEIVNEPRFKLEYYLYKVNWIISQENEHCNNDLFGETIGWGER